ncbi:MAG: hypothetical protein QHH10_11630 [Peptococcaceae bacterium]|nr:hypothetical protein [Peptococcaceae bacterium]MDH7525952.1 hypothetical protein [Peptococcaceae bacterium]
MKNLMYFAGAVAVMLVGLVFTAAGRIFWGALLFIAGLILLVHWNTISYRWQCKSCGAVFSINMRQTFTGLNSFRSKLLYCPRCGRRTWCRSVVK